MQALVCALPGSVECGQMGVDVVGFGDAEVGVENEGLVPVVAGLIGIAGGVVGVGEAVVGAGLLVAGHRSGWPR